SHTYGNNGKHTITTTVVELGQAVDKIGDERPGGDVVLFRGHDDDGELNLVQPAGTAAIPPASSPQAESSIVSHSRGADAPTLLVSAAPSGRQQVPADALAGSVAGVRDQIFSRGLDDLMLAALGSKGSNSLADSLAALLAR